MIECCIISKEAHSSEFNLLLANTENFARTAANGTCTRAALQPPTDIFMYFNGLAQMPACGTQPKCSLAAFSENLELLQYVHANGCGLDAAACAAAATAGNLKWARINGCNQ